MARRYGWMLLALAACGDGEGGERAEARADSAAAPVPAAPAPTPAPAPPPAAPPVEVERGRFAADVQGLPVASTRGRARFCAGGSTGSGFGLVLSTDDKYAIHLYRLAGPPAPGLYEVVPRSEQPQQFATADGFFLSTSAGAAIPLMVLPGGEVLVESADSGGVTGTVRLSMRTHLQSRDNANTLPASPENPFGFNPNETRGTVTAAFQAVNGGSCNAINQELMADIPEALRRPPARP
jgi:hypothetical protein